MGCGKHLACRRRNTPFYKRNSINYTQSKLWDDGPDQKYDQNTPSDPWKQRSVHGTVAKCMAVVMKTVLFTDGITQDDDHARR